LFDATDLRDLFYGAGYKSLRLLAYLLWIARLSSVSKTYNFDLDFVAVLADHSNYVNYYLLCIYLLNTKCLVPNVICYITQDIGRRLAA